MSCSFPPTKRPCAPSARTIDSNACSAFPLSWPTCGPWYWVMCMCEKRGGGGGDWWCARKQGRMIVPFALAYDPECAKPSRAWVSQKRKATQRQRTETPFELSLSRSAFHNPPGQKPHAEEGVDCGDHAHQEIKIHRALLSGTLDDPCSSRRTTQALTHVRAHTYTYLESLLDHLGRRSQKIRGDGSNGGSTEMDSAG